MIHTILQPLSRISQQQTTVGAVRAYVPLTIVNRGIAFLRMLAVAWVLGAKGMSEFGLYQPALELINWLVPLVMFGLGDVAERYVSHYEHRGELRSFLSRQFFRLLLIGMAATLVLLALAPVAGRWIFGFQLTWMYATALFIAAAVNVVTLALYQWLVAVLRGLRAYSSAAAMETVAAVGLLLFSILAVWAWRNALALLLAYFFANLLALLWFGFLARRFARTLPANPPDATPLAPASLGSFGRWTLLRLLLVMTFGFLTLWGVLHLARHNANSAVITAQFALPYRIAQLLAYLALTLWAATYGLAARAWARQQHHRALVSFLQIGKFGGVFLLLSATTLVLLRDFMTLLMPASYADGLLNYLPPLAGLFIGYGMLAFLTTLADIQERPWVGASLWAMAVGLQTILLFFLPQTQSDPASIAITASALGLAAALFILAPLLLWRPFRLSATAFPIVLITLSMLVFFSPTWIVNIFISLTALLITCFLLFSGLLIRPRQRRYLRRWWSAHFPPAKIEN